MNKNQLNATAALKELRPITQFMPWSEDEFIASCAKGDDTCSAALIGLLQDSPDQYKNVISALRKISRDWHPAKLKIIFSQSLKDKQMGQQTLQRNGNLFEPTIHIDANISAAEKLLTFAHELHHVSSIEKHLDKMNDATKIKGCLTSYQWLRLQDEHSAYLEEIRFWDELSAKLKSSLAKQKFKSQLLQEELRFAEYYAKLASKMKDEPYFIVKQYARLELAPACALELIPDRK